MATLADVKAAAAAAGKEVDDVSVAFAMGYLAGQKSAATARRLERPLTAAEISHFREHGYVVVKGALLPADLEVIKGDLIAKVETQIRAWSGAGRLPAAGAGLEELLALPFRTRLATVVVQMRVAAAAEGAEASAKLQEELAAFGLSLDTMYARSRGTFDFLFTKRLVDVMESLLGTREVTLSPIQHLRPYLPAEQGDQKGAGAGSLAPWHQDMGVTREEARGVPKGRRPRRARLCVLPVFGARRSGHPRRAGRVFGQARSPWLSCVLLSSSRD